MKSLVSIFVDEFVSSRGKLQLVTMCGDKRVDMALALVFQNLIYGYQDARFLNVAKAVVDGCTKELHRWR